VLAEPVEDVGMSHGSLVPPGDGSALGSPTQPPRLGVTGGEDVVAVGGWTGPKPPPRLGRFVSVAQEAVLAGGPVQVEAHGLAVKQGLGAIAGSLVHCLVTGLQTTKQVAGTPQISWNTISPSRE